MEIIMWKLEEQFKIRSSAIGRIMTDPVGKTPLQLYVDTQESFDKKSERFKSMKNQTGPGGIKLKKSIDDLCDILPTLKADKDRVLLSESTKSYCKEWLTEYLFDKRKMIDSKQIRKGNQGEDHGIDLVARQLNLGMLFKNEESAQDKFKTGTGDIVLKQQRLGIDVKCSWSAHTFPMFEDELTNDDYWWQGQGYMDLYDLDEFIVAYVLIDTPIEIIEGECWRYCKNNGFEFDEKIQYFIDQMTYDNIPEDLRIKTFKFERDPGAIEKVHIRVNECRNYIDELVKQLQK